VSREIDGQEKIVMVIGRRSPAKSAEIPATPAVCRKTDRNACKPLCRFSLTACLFSGNLYLMNATRRTERKTPRRTGRIIALVLVVSLSLGARFADGSNVAQATTTHAAACGR
jgi:hypothetical protein